MHFYYSGYIVGESRNTEITFKANTNRGHGQSLFWEINIKGGVEILQKHNITFTLFREKELLNIFQSFMKVDYHENLEFIIVNSFLLSKLIFEKKIVCKQN